MNALPCPGRALEAIARTLYNQKLLKESHLREVLPGMRFAQGEDYGKVLQVFIDHLVSEVCVAASQDPVFKRMKESADYAVCEESLAKNFAISNLKWIEDSFAKIGYNRPPPPPMSLYDVCLIS